MNINLMNLTQEDIEAVIEARKEKARDQRLEELFEEVKNDLDEIYELGGRVLGESYGGRFKSPIYSIDKLCNVCYNIYKSREKERH